MSFVLLAPATILMEGVKFTPAFVQSAVSKAEMKFWWVFNFFVEIVVNKGWFSFLFFFIWGQGLDLRQIYTRSLFAALCFHAYQQVHIYECSALNLLVSYPVPTCSLLEKFHLLCLNIFSLFFPPFMLDHKFVFVMNLRHLCDPMALGEGNKHCILSFYVSIH